jgi:hypothetical protein
LPPRPEGLAVLARTYKQARLGPPGIAAVTVACVENRHYRKLFGHGKGAVMRPSASLTNLTKWGIKVQVGEGNLKKCRKQWDSVSVHHFKPIGSTPFPATALPKHDLVSD